jgi:hypothetical protein
MNSEQSDSDQVNTSEVTVQRIQDTKLRLLEGIEKCGGNITRAAKFAGVNPSTYYQYCKDSETFKLEAHAKTREAKETRLDEITDSLYDQAIGTDGKPSVIAGIFLAKCLGRTSDDPSRQFNDTPKQEQPTEEVQDTKLIIGDITSNYI